MCLADSVQESESNNDVGSANAVPLAAGGSATFCGRIDSASDVDVLTFTLPVGANGIGLHRYADVSSPNSNDISVVPALDGTAFAINGAYPYQPGKAYTVTVSTTGRAPINYRIVMCAHDGSCP
jgi:hypothetical protein